MLWNSLADVQRATRIEFAAWLAAKHHFVKCPSGKWTRTLGAPDGCRNIRARVWEIK